MTDHIFKPKVLKSTKASLYRELKNKADEMRKHPTPAEAELWKYLNNHQMGVKFRRQHIIERFSRSQVPLGNAVLTALRSVSIQDAAHPRMCSQATLGNKKKI